MDRQLDWVDLLFSYQGRINRAKLWLAALIYGVAYWVAYFVVYFVAYSVADSVGWIIGFASAFTLAKWLTGFVALVSLVSGICVAIKRLHDLNKSGRLLLGYGFAAGLLAIAAFYFGGFFIVGHVMVAGIISALVIVSAVALFGGALVQLFCQPGTVGPNQYGPDPLARPAQASAVAPPPPPQRAQ